MYIYIYTHTHSYIYIYIYILCTFLLLERRVFYLQIPLVLASMLYTATYIFMYMLYTYIFNTFLDTMLMTHEKRNEHKEHKENTRRAPLHIPFLKPDTVDEH